MKYSVKEGANIVLFQCSNIYATCAASAWAQSLGLRAVRYDPTSKAQGSRLKNLKGSADYADLRRCSSAQSLGLRATRYDPTSKSQGSMFQNDLQIKEKIWWKLLQCSIKLIGVGRFGNYYPQMDELFWETSHQLNAQSWKLKGIRRLRRFLRITSEALIEALGRIKCVNFQIDWKMSGWDRGSCKTRLGEASGAGSIKMIGDLVGGYHFDRIGWACRLISSRLRASRLRYDPTSKAESSKRSPD